MRDEPELPPFEPPPPAQPGRRSFEPTMRAEPPERLGFEPPVSARSSFDQAPEPREPQPAAARSERPSFEPLAGSPEPRPMRPEPQPTLAVRAESLFEPHIEPLGEPEARPEPRRAAAQPAAAGQPAQQRWPIQPLDGEPPLTLFRGKRLIDLAPGTEVDRFGEPNGNLAYVAGTPFGERSLVPEWIERPYHTYRVARPVQVLTGTAIPWFDQIGGGTAYLLPKAIADLLADGHLVEVPGRKPPAV
jgi:hypothetical protein